MSESNSSMSYEAATIAAAEITKHIVNHQQVHEFIHRTVDFRSGVPPASFVVGEDGIRSAFVMVERGQPIDIPEGTWRFLDLQSEAGFEFARYALRKQMEQWGVVFQSDHMTLAEAEAKERTRIKPGANMWGFTAEELASALNEDKLKVLGISPEFLNPDPHAELMKRKGRSTSTDFWAFPENYKDQHGNNT